MCKMWWLCSAKLTLGTLCASFVVQSSTGKYFVQTWQCKVVLGGTLCKFCRAAKYWEVLRANFVVQSSFHACLRLVSYSSQSHFWFVSDRGVQTYCITK